FSAPYSSGVWEERVLAFLADMGDQLEGYEQDLAVGKVPAVLRPTHYGTTVWLTVTRRRLVAREATRDIDSTFVRRHQVEATIGLPLVSGDRFLGLVYLSYTKGRPGR